MISMPGSLAVRMDADQPPARPQRPDQRRHHLRGLELDARPRPIGLRGDDQIVIRHHPAGPRHDRIEQERMILAPQRQDDRPLIDRIAGGRADARAPVLGQEAFELADLLGEAVRGVAGQRDVLPDQALRRRHRARRQPRRLGIIEVGDDQHGGGMLEQAIRHLLQHQADVFVADLLGHDVERHGREARMHRPHHPRQHGAVADAGIEDPQRRRRRLQIAELERNPAGRPRSSRCRSRRTAGISGGCRRTGSPAARRRRRAAAPFSGLGDGDGLPGAGGRSRLGARTDRRGPCRACRS